jgi:hypothetical protein
MHRFTHSFVVQPTRFRWKNRVKGVLSNCASELERETKHGTPATSVAGVYAFMGLAQL